MINSPRSKAFAALGTRLKYLREHSGLTRARFAKGFERDGQEAAKDLNLASVALSLGNFDEAKDYANRVLNSGDIKSDSKVSAKLVLLQIRARQGSFKGVLDELETLFIENPHIELGLQSRIGNEIIRVCYRSGNLGIGAQKGEQMLRDFADIWPDPEIVELLNQVASCHFHRGDTGRAEEITARALDLAEKCKSPKAITQSHWQLSLLADSRGELPLALEHSMEAIHWSKFAELQQLIPTLNNNMALILLDLPNPDFARIHDLALAAYLELSAQNNPGLAVYACLTLSEVALRQENYTAALLYAQKGSEELPPEIPGPKTSLLIQEAKVLARMVRYEESEIRLAIAMEHMATMEPSKELARFWGEVARVFVEVGLGDRAIYAYEQALQIAGLSREEQEAQVK